MTIDNTHICLLIRLVPQFLDQEQQNILNMMLISCICHKIEEFILMYQKICSSQKCSNIFYPRFFSDTCMHTNS